MFDKHFFFIYLFHVGIGLIPSKPETVLNFLKIFLVNVKSES
jgi:hypothetical protein